MRTSSNPAFRNLPPQAQGGYAGFGANAANNAASYGAAAAAANHGVGTPDFYDTRSPGTRPLTIDDVVTKTGISLGILIVSAAVSFFLIGGALGDGTEGLGLLLTAGGGIGALGLVLFTAFRRRLVGRNVAIAYAVLEGFLLGGFSSILSGAAVGDSDAGIMIGQAIVGTVGVFAGMLYVYKSGAIRVTPRFTRMMIGALIGVLALSVFNFVGAIFFDFNPLRDGGPIAIIFSLVCIGLAAFSFLMDFDQADQMIRAGAPEETSWHIAFGLTVTLAWLYIEILRLLSYFRN